MPGVTKVNGFVEAGQFIGRDVLGVTVTLAAAPAAVNGKINWPELNDAVAALQQRHSVTIIGEFGTGDTEVNMIIEGVGGQTVAEIATETGLTLAEFAI
jgi:hypothetical protein